jgi:hypothetical protein
MKALLMMKKTLGSECWVFRRSKIFANLRGYTPPHSLHQSYPMTIRLFGQSSLMGIELPVDGLSWRV